MALSPALLEILRCPESGERLSLRDGVLVSESGRTFPMVDGVPVLLSSYWTPIEPSTAAPMESSGFSPKLLRALGKWLPPLDRNLGSRKAYDEFFGASVRGGHCLIIGAGDDSGANRRLAEHFGTCTVTDIVKGPDTNVICDGHAIPFADNSFDSAVVVAVLEHVLSPEKVVAELTRVLKPGGIIYADTAFMQQVHMGRFDFCRFTDLGHRWLFRSFEEILRSNAGGPASALAWSITYFWLSFVGTSRVLRLGVRAIVRLLFFWVHWFDHLIHQTKPARDAASGVIFVGRNKKTPTVTPRELIGQYYGGF